MSSLNLKYLRSIVGVVSQEPVLFNMSIADRDCKATSVVASRAWYYAIQNGV